MITESWVTANEVAQHLGVVKGAVYRWRERTGLPAHKKGRIWKFQLSKVDEQVRTGGHDGGLESESEGKRLMNVKILHAPVHQSDTPESKWLSGVLALTGLSLVVRYFPEPDPFNLKM